LGVESFLPCPVGAPILVGVEELVEEMILKSVLDTGLRSLLLDPLLIPDGAGIFVVSVENLEGLDT
jgi:hypothetical protein